MPLVDVVFLLLTFFVFALVLMVRADVLGVTLPEFGAGQAVQRESVMTISIDEQGGLRLDGEPIELESLAAAVRAALEARVGSPPRVVIAADQRSASGALLGALDALTAAGVPDVSIMGRPRGASPTPTDPADPATPESGPGGR